MANVGEGRVRLGKRDWMVARLVAGEQARATAAAAAGDVKENRGFSKEKKEYKMPDPPSLASRAEEWYTQEVENLGRWRWGYLPTMPIQKSCGRFKFH